MRLNIMNQTNDEIKLYLNNLDVSINVKANEKYESGILSMDFHHTYPLYIGIKFANNITKYHIFKRKIPPKSMKRLFYVIVYNERAYFFEEGTELFGHRAIIEDDLGSANRLDSSEWMYYNGYGTRYNCLELLIINDTKGKRKVIFNDSINESQYELDIGEARLIKITDPIFLQGNIYENIDYKYYSIETENISRGIYRKPIRLEDGIQILRMIEYDSGITISPL